MVSNWARMMTQQATYWAPGAADEYGRRRFTAEPAVVLCRWQDQEDLVRDAPGDQEVPETIVYVDRPVEVGGFLARGSVADAASGGEYHPRDVEGAREVRRAYLTTSHDGQNQLTKAWL